MPRRATPTGKTRRTTLEMKVDGLIERVESLTLEVGSLAATIGQALRAGSVPWSSVGSVGRPTLPPPPTLMADDLLGPAGTFPAPAPMPRVYSDQALDLNDDLAAELAEDADDEPAAPDAGALWDLWARRLALYRRNRMWQPDWGARPDQAACAAPRDLLRENGFSAS